MNRKNPFKARPERYHGATQRGVTSHPGFHTADFIDYAAPYAQAKGIPPADYPVVLEFDLRGLPYKSDYDAEKALEACRDALTSYGHNDFGAFKRAIESFAHGGSEEEDSLVQLEHGASGVDILFGNAQAYNRPVATFADYAYGLDNDAQLRALFEGLIAGTLPSKTVADIFKQRRYLADVESDRLTAVFYMPPVAKLFYAYGSSPDPDKDVERIAALEEKGWQVFTEDETQAGSVTVKYHEVWRTQPEPGAPQYHGTSYRNLLLAAPHLRAELPTPPPPYAGE